MRVQCLNVQLFNEESMIKSRMSPTFCLKYFKGGFAGLMFSMMYVCIVAERNVCD